MRKDEFALVDKMIADAYKQGRADERPKAFANGYESGYKQGRADAIEEFANWLPQNFDLRFSNNPSVWIDEYFNHTREKILEQLKENSDGNNDTSI